MTEIKGPSHFIHWLAKKVKQTDWEEMDRVARVRFIRNKSRAYGKDYAIGLREAYFWVSFMEEAECIWSKYN